MIADVTPLLEADVQSVSGKLVWNETEVDMCFADVRHDGVDFVRVGDGFESNFQGLGCSENAAMEAAFNDYGIPENACLTVRTGNVDHEYCAPLNKI